MFLARVRVSSQCAIKRLALAVVRFSSGYFAVLECIPHSMQEGLRVSR